MRDDRDDMDKIGEFLDQLSLPKLNFSAQRGDVYAQCSLAVFLESSGDHASAAYWYRLSAEQGNSQAQYNLGGLFLEGRGVDQNYFEAIKWFTEAAQQGYINAIYNLAYMNEHGFGCKEDKVKAYRLYKQAADQGDFDSQCKLALILLDKSDQKRIKINPKDNDWPVSSNSNEARKLFELASDNGHKLSTGYLIALGWKT
jgi:TPR repeat protein